MKKRMLSLMLAVSLISSMLAGCGNKEAADTKEAATQAATEAAAAETEKAASEEKTEAKVEVPSEPTDGGTLTIALSSSPMHLDPVKYTGTYESQIIYQICDTVVIYDQELAEIKPNIATSWEIVDDITYVFEIRDDVWFHPGKYVGASGRLMTAEDVAYSLNRSAKESAMNRVDMLDYAEVVDDTHVKCVLKAPTSTFLTALTNAGNVIVPKEEVEGWGDEFGAHLVGTGPFVMESFELDNQTVMTKNEKYFVEAPHLDKVIFKVITDPNQRVNALLSGDINIAMQLTGETVQTVDQAEAVTLMRRPGIQINYGIFNTTNGPTADPKVREALLMAVDSESLAKGVYQYGEGEAHKLALPKGSWGYDASLEADVPAYDIEGAKALLAEAGYPDGFEMTCWITNEAIRQKACTILQAYWAQIGVNMKIETVEWGVFSDKVSSGQADFYAMAWTWYPDPYFFLNKMFHSSAIGSTGNGGNYNNPEVDRLLDEALVKTDQNERAALYKEALKIITNDDVGVYYGNAYECLGIEPKVQGFYQRADGTIKLVTPEENVWLAQ